MRLFTPVLLIALSLCQFKAFAQVKVDKEVAKEVKGLKDEGQEIKEGWTKGTSINAAFNQASLTNWFAGGENFSMGLNTLLKANANYKKKKVLFKSNLDAAYGLLSSTSTKGIRKTDDRWVITSSLNSKASTYWYYTVAAQIKSQFTDGYTYDNNVKSKAQSAIFAPADIKLGLGFTYQKTKNFSAYISPLTAKLNLKLDRRFYDQKIFGVDSAKKSSMDLGGFLRFDLTKEIKKDIKYTGSLDAFYGYLLNNYNFYFSNTINWKLNKYFGLSAGLDIAYDNTQPSYKYEMINGVNTKVEGKAKLQLKQLFGLGFSFSK